MKLAAREVETFLKNPGKVAGALIYGADGGMVRQRVQQLSSVLLGGKPDPSAITEFTADQLKDDPALLADALSSFSLMAPQQVILIREAEDSTLPAIESALKLRASTNYLIAYSTDSLAGSKLRAFAEYTDQLGCVPCYKDEGAGLETVIRDALRGHGLRANAEVLRFLAGQLNGDRQIVLNEIEKLALYIGFEREEVTLEDAAASMGENNERSMDDLSAAVAAGDKVAICRLSDRLLAEGQVGLLLVRAVMRYLARLRDIAAARASGQSLDAAIDGLRPPVFFKVKPQLKAHASRWTVPACTEALAQLQILELDTKRHHDQVEARLAHGLLQVAALGQSGR